MKTKKQIESLGYKVSFTNGTGAGGQKRNRTYSVAVLVHIESGIKKVCDETRTANKNMNIAFEIIQSKIKDNAKDKLELKINEARKKATARGTIRTYDFKQGIVKNHLTGTKANLKKVMNGNIEIINK